jgi:hypothetical protein
MFTPAVARSYADRHTLAQLRDIQDACLLVHQDGGEIHKSLGSGSISINLANCETILENIIEALRIKGAEEEDADSDLTAVSFSSGVSFAKRYIE